LEREEWPRQDTGMKFGIAFANTAFYSSTAGAIALAQGAEAVGVDSLWTVELAAIGVHRVTLAPPKPGDFTAIEELIARFG
jgi:hypothetical protein